MVNVIPGIKYCNKKIEEEIYTQKYTQLVSKSQDDKNQRGKSRNYSIQATVKGKQDC